MSQDDDDIGIVLSPQKSTAFLAMKHPNLNASFELTSQQTHPLATSTMNAFLGHQVSSSRLSVRHWLVCLCTGLLLTLWWSPSRLLLISFRSRMALRLHLITRAGVLSLDILSVPIRRKRQLISSHRQVDKSRNTVL